MKTVKIVNFYQWGYDDEYDELPNFTLTKEAEEIMGDKNLFSHLVATDDKGNILNRDLRCDPRLVELAEKGRLVVEDAHWEALIDHIPEDIGDGWSIHTIKIYNGEVYPYTADYNEDIWEGNYNENSIYT